MSTTDSANVARYLVERASQYPDAPAVFAPLRRMGNSPIRYEEVSFSGLHRQSEQIAHGLVARGLTRGTRTLLMVRPGADLIRCCFALFKVGAVPIVIDPGMGLKNFLACVRRTRPEALVGIGFAHFVSRIFPGTFASIRYRVKVGAGFANWYADFPTADFEICNPGPDDLAAILFTSGSTGPPKGVCYGHGQFDSQVRLIRDTFNIQPGEIDLPMLPVFALFNPALGMTTVVPEMNPGKPAKVDPAKLLQAIDQRGVTNSFGSPVLWKKIALHARRNGSTHPSLRRILMAGAPVPPSLVELLEPVFPNARLWSPYGATECLPVTCIDGVKIRTASAVQTVKGAGTCVGLPVTGVRVRIISIQDQPIPSMDDCEEVPVGSIGEIIATGPSVTKSYDALPEATAKAKILDHESTIWHRMGDAGYIDQEGCLWFCGRIAERVITEKGTLYTDCCEGIFNSMTGVNRSALIGLGKAPDQRPAIVIERDPGARVSASDVLEFAGRFAVTRPIKAVYFARSFPVDVRHNAKIHRLELAERFQTK